MLKKISGLARALYIMLAVVTGFVALGMMNVALVLAATTVIALPAIGAALGHIPTIGAQLTVMAGNLQLGVAGALASAIAIYLYHLVMEGVMGIMGGATTRATAVAAE